MPCFMGVNFHTPPAEGYRTEVPTPNLCSYPAQEVVWLTVLPNTVIALPLQDAVRPATPTLPR